MRVSRPGGTTARRPTWWCLLDELPGPTAFDKRTTRLLGSSFTLRVIAYYLLLLSLCHTCRYKGVSFLKFLLSCEQDVDVFCEGKQQRREATLETYPAGFIPPHFKHRQTAKQAGESGVAQEQAAPDKQVAQRSPSAGEM